MNRDLRYSILDGMFAGAFATLTGGMFLTGLALYLNMNAFLIGLIGAMPFLATVFQIPASCLIEKNGHRKKVSCFGAAGARLVWVPIVLAAFLPGISTPNKAYAVLALVFFSYSLASMSYVSWLSWMSDLVPENTRGSFFGTRNMLVGSAGMLAMLVFGNFLEHMKGSLAEGLPIGLCVTFGVAVLFGVLSLRFLVKISEPPTLRAVSVHSMRRLFDLPLRDANFRRFLLFAILWSFSVHLAAPFFPLFFLRDLGFTYGFIGVMGVLSGFADLVGMRFWGVVSDRTRNKAIIRFCCWFAALLPFAWTWVTPGSTFAPVLLHVVGGGMWAGITLCTNNLLLAISPRENKVFYLSAYNILGGLGAAAGPVVSGWLVDSVLDHVRILQGHLLPLQAVFLLSTVSRLASMQLVKYVEEPYGLTFGNAVRVLRSVRGLNTASGFSYLLHPFIEIGRTRGEGEDKR